MEIIIVTVQLTRSFLLRNTRTELFGGGELFHVLLGMRQADTVEVSTMPVLLGGGV